MQRGVRVFTCRLRMPSELDPTAVHLFTGKGGTSAFIEPTARGLDKDRLLGAAGIATSNKKLLGAPGLTTRNKDATRGSWPYS